MPRSRPPRRKAAASAASAASAAATNSSPIVTSYETLPKAHIPTLNTARIYESILKKFVPGITGFTPELERDSTGKTHVIFTKEVDATLLLQKTDLEKKDGLDIALHKHINRKNRTTIHQAKITVRPYQNPYFAKQLQSAYVNFSHRLGMWFAAGQADGEENYLSDQDIPKEAIESIKYHLDGNQEACFYLVYDPQLLKEGLKPEIDKLETEYAERFVRLNVNDRSLFLDDNSTSEEIAIYYYALYQLSLAQSKDPKVRASVCMAAIKDMLQLLSKCSVYGNIMDLTDNVLINQRLKAWARLTTGPTPFVAQFISLADNSFAVNDLFMPTFSEKKRSDDTLNPAARDFLKFAIIKQLAYLLPPGTDDGFLNFLEKTCLLSEEEINPIKNLLSECNEHNPDALHNAACKSIGLLLSPDESSLQTERLNQVLTKMIDGSDKQKLSYPNIVYLLKMLSYEKYCEIMTDEEWKGATVKNKADFIKAQSSAYTKFIMDTTGPNCWKLALDELATKTLGMESGSEKVWDLVSPQFNKVGADDLVTSYISRYTKADLLPKGIPTSRCISSFFFSPNTSAAPAFLLMLLVADPKAYLIIMTGQKTWIPNASSPTETLTLKETKHRNTGMFDVLRKSVKELKDEVIKEFKLGEITLTDLELAQYLEKASNEDAGNYLDIDQLRYEILLKVFSTLIIKSKGAANGPLEMAAELMLQQFTSMMLNHFIDEFKRKAGEITLKDSMDEDTMNELFKPVFCKTVNELEVGDLIHLNPHVVEHCMMRVCRVTTETTATASQADSDSSSVPPLSQPSSTGLFRRPTAPSEKVLAAPAPAKAPGSGPA